MPIRDMLLPEFDQEMAHTRKHLERVPEDRLTWKPHAKSWDMTSLATHVANIPSWVVYTFQHDALDIAPPGVEPQKQPPAASRKELLDAFDKNAAAARAVLAEVSDEHIVKPWSLLKGGKTLFTSPRIACVRSFVMNHLIHHRAQLGVYLRINDIAVPAVYGPSADEEGM